jgi:hypothetical protein
MQIPSFMSQALGSVFLLAVTTLVGFVACGGSDAGNVGDPSLGPDASDDASLVDVSQTPSEGGGPVPTPGVGAAYCNATLGVYETAYGKCCSPDDMQTMQYKVTIGLLTFGIDYCTSRLESGLSKGRLSYDPSAAATCYPGYKQAVDMGTCGPLVPTANPEVLTGCTNIFKGLVAEGGACIADHECVSGLTCVGWNQTSDGICKKPPAIGDPCGEGANDAGTIDVNLHFAIGVHPPCAPGGYCSFHKCVAQAQPGGTCGSDDQCPGTQKCRLGMCSDTPVQDVGGACKNTSECKKPLYCDQPSFGAQGTCQPPKSAGEACGPSIPCKGFCDRPDGGATGSCKAYCGSQ